MRDPCNKAEGNRIIEVNPRPARKNRKHNPKVQEIYAPRFGKNRNIGWIALIGTRSKKNGQLRSSRIHFLQCKTHLPGIKNEKSRNLG